MSREGRDAVIYLMIASLLTATTGCGHRATPPKVPLTPQVFRPLQEELNKSYDELFQEAPGLEYSQQQIDDMRKYLDEANDYCVGQFKQRSEDYGQQLEATQDELKQRTRNLSDEQRHELHCKIQNLRALRSQVDVLANQAIPLAYDNKRAKLDLIEKWPAELRQLKQAIASDSYHDREFGDPQDIGFREIASGQQDDVKVGEDAVRQMRQAGLMPPEVENEVVTQFVTNMAKEIAAHSDLQVPVKVTVLNSKEINAFALPGGYLFVQRGLIEAADDDAELAGVLAHEIAHAADRHGHKLMRKATIASIIYQAAQVAALVLTGGAAGIGTYYALQYGFYGLGLVLSLDLLGVSREFEEQADILGVQYAWNTGYDPGGFTRFFDKMATEKGYVNGVSWFRTHPPFYERMVATKREMMFLPKKDSYITLTEDFRKMKKELEKVTAQAEEEEKGRPSLRAPEEGCPPPDKIEYESGQPIEQLCQLPGANNSGNLSRR